MKLSIRESGTKKIISSIKFNDNAIIEVITFWTNTRYQSPQFPLDLTPNINQLGTLYKNGKVGEFSKDTYFKVKCDDERIRNLRIVQLKMNFIGLSDTIPTAADWEEYFVIQNAKWCITPDGSAYITPMAEDSKTISLQVSDDHSTDPKYFSYEVLVAFQIEGVTYYANFDPLMKITNHSAD